MGVRAVFLAAVYSGKLKLRRNYTGRVVESTSEKGMVKKVMLSSEQYLRLLRKRVVKTIKWQDFLQKERSTLYRFFKNQRSQAIFQKKKTDIFQFKFKKLKLFYSSSKKLEVRLGRIFEKCFKEVSHMSHFKSFNRFSIWCYCMEYGKNYFVAFKDFRVSSLRLLEFLGREMRGHSSEYYFSTLICLDIYLNSK